MPGYYDASPPEPDPSPCEAIDCEFWDWVKEECAKGQEPENCPKLQYMDKETLGDREYHRRVDEGEIR